MTGRELVPAYIYEELCGALLIDPVQVSADITAGVQEIQQALSVLQSPPTTAMPKVLPPPPVRKELSA